MLYTISQEDHPHEEDIRILENGISEFDAKNIGPSQPITFAFFIRDENGKIVGGSDGRTIYGHMFVAHLWVTEALRRKGYGCSLIHAIDKLARERSCRFIALNTMNSQAINFYKKLGFYVEFERHGFENNAAIYYLRKDLV